MADPFESPKSLLARAKVHCDEYRYKHSIYDKKRPYQFLTERNPLTGEEIRKVRVNEGYPFELGTIAFDAINCLRSAMDHAVFAATTVLTAKSFDPKTVKFPFGDSLEGVQTELDKGRARNVPKELHPVLLKFEPYKGGDKTLYGFNKIRNENIHRILTPVAAQSNSLTIGGNGRIGALTIFNEWNPAKRELTYAKGRNIDRGIEIQITVQISFSEGSGLPLMPVIGALDRISRTTGSIIAALEGETARLLANGPS